MLVRVHAVRFDVAVVSQKSFVQTLSSSQKESLKTLVQLLVPLIVIMVS